MNNWPRILTKPAFRTMLSIIGSSAQPLSSYAIKEQAGESKYAYVMLRKLVGLPEKSGGLVKVLSNPNYQRRARKLNKKYQDEYLHALRKIAVGPRFLEITFDPANSSYRRKWKYSLNFRGFLLYLICESLAERQDIRRIRRVLSNITITNNNTPFLTYWQDFEKLEFNVIGILRSIAIEFQDQLGRDESYLLHRVSERYFIEFCNYFDFLQSPLYFHRYVGEVDLDTHAKISEYRQRMFTILRGYLQSDMNEIERWSAAYTA